MTGRGIWRIAGGLAVSGLTGALFAWGDVPLAWIFGSLLGSAVYANLVGPLGPTHLVRRSGQLLIGASVASVLSPETLGELVGLVPAMLGAALLANLAGILVSFPLARWGKVDRLSALLASLPAGMAEMGSLAAELNARADFVTVVHSLRVVLVVVTVPLLIGFEAGSFGAVTAAPAGGSVGALLACAVLGFALALLADRLHVLNPWVIMPMAVGIGLVAAGYQLAPMPEPLLVLAQVVIGFSLGTRLRREDLARLPRATLAGLAGGLLLIAVMMVAAVSLAAATALDVAALALGMAPGGLGEMIATAKAMGLASATVASFQFVRSFLTNLIAPILIVRLFKRKRGS